MGKQSEGPDRVSKQERGKTSKATEPTAKDVRNLALARRETVVVDEDRGKKFKGKALNIAGGIGKPLIQNKQKKAPGVNHWQPVVPDIQNLLKAILRSVESSNLEWKGSKSLLKQNGDSSPTHSAQGLVKMIGNQPEGNLESFPPRSKAWRLIVRDKWWKWRQPPWIWESD